MNWVDLLRTSANKRMWSGRRAVVMRTGRRAELLGVKLGCPRSRCRAVAAALSFQMCFACVDMYILYACVYICVCVYVCGHDMCINMHVCMYLYIYAFIHVCMCMCMHICS